MLGRKAQATGIFETTRDLGLKRFLKDPPQRTRHIRPQLRHQPPQLAMLLHSNAGKRRPIRRADLKRQHLQQKESKRKHIAARMHALAVTGRLLRRHIAARTDRLPRRSLLPLTKPRDPEINNLDDRIAARPGG